MKIDMIGMQKEKIFNNGKTLKFDNLRKIVFLALDSIQYIVWSNSNANAPIFQFSGILL
jgi:hypothetical protein